MKTYYCNISGKPLSQLRVDALQHLGVHPNQWCDVQFSTVRRKKGLFFGTQGSGELIVANKIGHESLSDLDEALEQQEKCDALRT